MNAWDWLIAPVAKSDASSRLFDGNPAAVGREAMEGSGLELQWIIPIAGVFMIVFSMWSLIRYLRKHRLRPHAVALFNRLARRAGLSWADRWMMWRIGRICCLSSPLTLMLCPGTLRYHARQYAYRLPRQSAAAVLQRVASIRRHLFAPTRDGA